MKRVALVLLIHLLTLNMNAQEWETVAYMPNAFSATQLKVISETNMIAASAIYSLRRYDGNEWSSIGDFDNSFSSPYFFYLSDDDIYATKNDYLNGDTETNYNYIAHWNGTEWSNAHNLNVAKTINNIHIVSDNEIYAVGEFTLPGFNWKPVAKYSDGTWSVLGLGDPNAGAYSTYSNLWVNNGNDVYATSGYSDSGVIRIKHWDGEDWEVYYGGLSDGVKRLSKSVPGDNGSIYAFGYRVDSGNSCITRWNGTNWAVLGNIEEDLNTPNSANNARIEMKYVSENEIYIIGNKLRDADTNKYKVAKWNGENWSELGQINANGAVLAMDIYDGYLYVTGSFSEATPDGNKVVVKRFDIESNLSIQNFDTTPKIDFYPNPAKNILHLNNPKAERFEVYIYDINGKLVLQRAMDDSLRSEINISTLTSGNYIITFESKTFKTSTKFIKN